VSSPPPTDNFAVLPVISEPAYTFNPVARELAG
jgi:hypothetical protein